MYFDLRTLFKTVFSIFLWFCAENVPLACTRVEALRCHGYTAEARRLAVAVARGIKYQQQLNIVHPGRQTGLYCSSHASSHIGGVSSRRGFEFEMFLLVLPV
jgi:hypothetical protein